MNRKPRQYLPGLRGLELLEKLREEGHQLPAIMITGNADVPMAVMAMKAGALDFIEKPIGREELLASIERALDLAHDLGQVDGMASESSGSPDGAHAATTRRHGARVGRTPKQELAADLGISQRTVENHRASIMKRTGSKSLPALAKLAFLASDGEEPRQAR